MQRKKKLDMYFLVVSRFIHLSIPQVLSSIIIIIIITTQVFKRMLLNIFLFAKISLKFLARKSSE